MFFEGCLNEELLLLNIHVQLYFITLREFFHSLTSRALCCWDIYFPQPGTDVKFIIKSSLFVLLLVVIRRPKLKPNSEQKVENIFVAPTYCQTACYMPFCSVNFFKCTCPANVA